ncbi:hypothetical protein D3C72_1590960 [compost metagenome]
MARLPPAQPSQMPMQTIDADWRNDNLPGIGADWWLPLRCHVRCAMCATGVRKHIAQGRSRRYGVQPPGARRGCEACQAIPFADSSPARRSPDELRCPGRAGWRRGWRARAVRCVVTGIAPAVGAVSAGCAFCRAWPAVVGRPPAGLGGAQAPSAGGTHAAVAAITDPLGVGGPGMGRPALWIALFSCCYCSTHGPRARRRFGDGAFWPG